jgi:ELWxxDGT repeat protein
MKKQLHNKILIYVIKTKLHYEILIYAMLLFVSESTFSQVTLIKDIYLGTLGSEPREITPLGNNVLFTANDYVLGRELWISDGTTSGTQLLKDINPETTTGNVSRLTKSGSFIYFLGYTNDTGAELWRTDGTNTGTILLKDINVGTGDGLVSPFFTDVNGILFFMAREDNNNRQQLWKSDGTEAGTVMVKNLRPNSASSTNARYFTATPSGLLYFVIDDGLNGRELWVSDGTESGTLMVKDLNTQPSTGYTYSPNNLIVLNDILYFGGYDDVNGFSLWRSDGTEIGTYIIKSDVQFEDKEADELSNRVAVFNNKIYFSGFQFTAISTYGIELFVSDGTESGTFMLKDINPGNSYSSPKNFRVVGNQLFFTATTYDEGTELWVTDGTEQGTHLVKDILNESNYSPSPPTFLTAVGNTLYFSATNGADGRELWKSDGTENGTIQVQDIIPSGSSSANNFVLLNNRLIMRVTHPDYGSELWKLDNVLSTEEYYNPSKIKIYPNPVSNHLTIENPFAKNQKLNVINQLGQTVLKQNNNASTTSLDVSNLSKGLYFLNINTETGESQTIKFIKN